jgi:Rap1a immunity proteins
VGIIGLALEGLLALFSLAVVGLLTLAFVVSGGMKSPSGRQTNLKKITLAGVLLATMTVWQDARAIETPLQLAKNCEGLEASTKGRRHKLEIPKTSAALLCWGYMQAMQDISALADPDGRRIAGSCPPEDGTLLDMIHAHVGYARSHQYELGDNTAAAVIKALQVLYPCP